MEELLSGTPGFVSVSTDLILGDITSVLPPTGLMLNPGGEAHVDREMVDAIERLAGQGYTIALDAWTVTSGARSLLYLADFIRINTQDYEQSALEDEVAHLASKDVKLIAAEVGTYRQLRDYRRLGFDYFQGLFISQPEALSGSRLPPSSLETLRLIARLQDPEVEVAELADIVRRDVSLSYRILRVVNSAHYALPRKVDSVEDAIMFLGLKQIAQWASVIKLSGISDKPAELTTTALIRARMCEQAAKAMQTDNANPFFTVGLFSVLDALLDIPMSDIIEALPLSDDIRGALVERTGPLSEVLQTVIAYEEADWGQVGSSDLSTTNLVDAYTDAVQWSDKVQTPPPD
jgi:EAL and modified HD-GYP domain-containing signal transduction protein